MRSSRKKWPGAWIGIVLASSFLLVGAMKMSAYAEPAESTETAEITESSTGAGLSDMDFGMGDGQIELDPYDQVSDLPLHVHVLLYQLLCGTYQFVFGYAAELETEEWHGSADRT